VAIRRKQLRIYLGILVFFVVGGGGLSASGSQEDELALARQRIVERRYNEALLILTEVIREDPEKSDEAESLIRQIRSFMGVYNDRYEELIYVLYEEKNVARALALIRELEALDPDPNPATALALVKAKESATFIYEQQEFTRIMNEALVLLNEGRFWEASTLYENGIGLGRERFDNARYGNIVYGRVDAVLASIREEATAFHAARDELEEAGSALRGAVEAGDGPSSAAAVNRYIQAYRPVARMVGNMLSAVSELQAQNAIALPDREDLFLGYTGRFIGGRQNSEVPEGIKGAAQRLLEAVSRPPIEILLDRAEARLEGGRSSVESRDRDWEAARGAFAETLRLTGEAARLFALWYEAFPGRGMFPGAEFWKLAGTEAPLYLRIQTVRAAAEGYTEAAGYLEPVEINDLAVRTTLPELREYRADVVRISGSLTGMMNAWRGFASGVGENPLAPEGTRNVSRTYRADLAAWQERVVDIELRTVEKMAALQITPVTEGVVSARNDYTAASGYMSGVQKEQEISPGVTETQTLYYPVEALEIFTGLTPRLNELEASAQAFLAAYGAEETRFVTYPGIAQRLTEGRADIAEIQRLRALIAPATADARTRSLQAERYKSEGNLRLNEVQAATAAGNFDAARRALAAARQSFSNSLALEDNEDLRRESDARLMALDSAMRDAENKQVIAEVRILIDQGRSLYEAGRYEEAESVLTRAQLRWETTQATEEPEIANLLGFVRAALFVGASREIRITDPLYNEMNQLLNLAREDYTRAQELAGGGNRREALNRLASAEEKIAQVKKVFPNNQTAGVLTLRIIFLRGGAAGDASVMFQNMFNDAAGRIDRNNREGTQEALVDLQNLQQINPNYSGMAQAIYRAEIALGIRIPPPDPRAVAESNRLTREANAIVLRNETAQFDLGLEMVNTALRLYPNNREAARIKSRLLDRGGTVVNVLPSAAEEQFRRAQQLFSGQSYFEALAIVERLLQTSEGKNYPPLQDLKRRIESQI
jgi:hypothetical protein